MNKFIIYTIVCLGLFSCKVDKTEVSQKKDTLSVVKSEESKVSEETIKVDEDGFLVVKIWKIYNSELQKELVILDEERKPMIKFKNEMVYIKDNSFKIIDEDYLYKSLIETESFDPEYGLFILKAKTKNDGFYEVLVNNKKCFIDGNKYADLVLFKSTERYILDSYPYPTKENPLRVEADENSEIVADFLNLTYVSVEINGDWLKIRDDKDCYPGEEPSEEDIIGWVRWRKEGIIILDIRHTC